MMLNLLEKEKSSEVPTEQVFAAYFCTFANQERIKSSINFVKLTVLVALWDF